MSATFETPKSTSPVNTPLWAAVGVLGIAVLAMGATLIRIQTRPEEPRLAVLATAAPAPMDADSLAPAAVSPIDGDKVLMQKMAAAPVHPAQEATKYVAVNTAKPVNPPSRTAIATTSSAGTTVAVHQGVAPVTEPICVNCGTVASVTPIHRDGAASGVGVVAGGVLGALVGNQVGGGNGKTAATILGALGGGYAGNTVEKKMKKETVYRMRVRMEDGSTRSVEQTTPAAVGAQVIVKGNTLHLASR